ncbi:hypothetical protein JOC25_000010 [Solibacillus kalamii]|uniref:Uncharacterized protein n=1 Tax=Solibacillus kalamii TaxID=1748298 RepID=A0ABX3ZHN3_9BACL|nr:hypothetical protein [Solibacillus kalamii]MBM7663554.1 hypothetical protein [Solibacillus kalamii]OUZ39182.1 hypothetical protein CBM15_09995 [Solibacillus kalamii]
MRQATRKSFMKLLTVAASAPKAVDEMLFGNAEDRTDDESEIRPYFYGSGTFDCRNSILLYRYW